MAEVSRKSKEKYHSPCIRNCCLNDDDICLGCFRTINEILNWRSATDDEKKFILAACLIRKEAAK